MDHQQEQVEAELHRREEAKDYAKRHPEPDELHPLFKAILLRHSTPPRDLAQFLSDVHDEAQAKSDAS